MGQANLDFGSDLVTQVDVEIAGVVCRQRGVERATGISDLCGPIVAISGTTVDVIRQRQRNRVEAVLIHQIVRKVVVPQVVETVTIKRQFAKVARDEDVAERNVAQGAIIVQVASIEVEVVTTAEGDACAKCKARVGFTGHRRSHRDVLVHLNSIDCYCFIQITETNVCGAGEGDIGCCGARECERCCRCEKNLFHSFLVGFILFTAIRHCELGMKTLLALWAALCKPPASVWQPCAWNGAAMPQSIFGPDPRWGISKNLVAPQPLRYRFGPRGHPSHTHTAANRK